MPDVSIVVVNYNTRVITADCLQSIVDNVRDLTYEITVVDNHSADGSVQYLGARFPRIKLISNEENRGYAVASNQGIRASTGNYILLLNSDTIVTPNAIEELYGFCESNAGVGLVSAQLYNPDATSQPTAAGLPDLKVFFSLYYRIVFNLGVVRRYIKGQRKKYSAVDEGAHSQRVNAVVGTCMFFPRRTFDAVGPLDENYFFYFEDVDFCRRILEEGLSIHVVPSAKIYHLREASNHDTVALKKLYYTSLYYYYEKYHSRRAALLVKWWDKARSLFRVLFYACLILLSLGRKPYFVKKIKQYYVVLTL